MKLQYKLPINDNNLSKSVSNRIFILILFIFIIFGCWGPASNNENNHEEGSTKNTKKLQLNYVESISFSKTNEQGILKIYTPWQKNSTSFVYCIGRDSAKCPPAVDFFINLPVNEMVCLSSTHVAALRFLGAGDQITGIANSEYLHDSLVRREVEKGTIEELGSMFNPDMEKLVTLQPDLIIESATGTRYDNYGKFKELGLTPFIFAAHEEIHPLGRLEWVKILGWITGNPERAIRKFEQLEKTYLNIARKANDMEKKPKVISGYVKKGQWIVPGGGSYMAQYIRDAGGDYMMDDNTVGNLHLDFEVLIEIGSRADFWLVHPYSKVTNMQELLAKEPRLEGLKAVQNSNVYNNNKRLNKAGRNDFWESGFVQPDVILKDLVEILHPSIIKHRLFYYRKL